MRLLGAHLIICATLVGTSTANAQQQTPPPAQNPFDLSAAKEALGDKVPTMAGVAQLEQRAQTLIAAGDCKTAVDALDRYAKEANSLSNLLARALKPYYDGSYDEKKRFSGSRLSQFVPIERLANDYKAKRNRAMVMQAECLAKLGDSQKAAAIYYQALGLIDIADTEWWDRAREGLFGLLQVTIPK